MDTTLLLLNERNDFRQISALPSPAPSVASVLPTSSMRVHPAHDEIGQWLRNFDIYIIQPCSSPEEDGQDPGIKFTAP